MTKIYKKVLSFVLSISVMALTIVGAFAVNFSSASANAGGSMYSWVDFKTDVLNGYPLEYWSNDDFAYFDNLVQTHIDDHDWLITIAIGADTSGIGGFVLDRLSCCIISTNSTGAYKWANDSTGKLITIGGSFNYFSDPSFFLCSDISQTPGRPIVYKGQLNNFHTSRFDNYVNWESANKFAPTSKTFSQSNAVIFTNQDIYDVGGNLILAKNLQYGPTPSYNNIIIKTGDQYYFTISDQLLIREGAAEDDMIQIQLGNSNNADWSDIYINYCIDFTYLALYGYPGITNISPNGILGWNITDILKYSDADLITFSQFSYSEKFGDNQVTITRDNVPDPWSTYYDYLNKLLELTESPNHITDNNPPSYIQHQIYTSYKSVTVAGGSMSDAGCVLLNEIPDVPFDSILVCSTKLFDDLGNHVDILNVQTTTTQFINYLNPYLLNSIDLIVVVPDTDFEYVLQGQPDHPDNFVNWNPYSWNIGVVSGQHGYFYYTSPSIRDTGVNDVSGFAFVTQRYLQKCQNYMLSDGIKNLYIGLNDITKNQDSLISVVINGAGAVYSSVQLCFGKLDELYNLLNDVKLADKLQLIIDKLDTISNNTEEGENNYWVSPLYWFIKLFEPSTSDYVNSIQEITDTLDELPVIPSVTPVRLPTSQVYLPGE